MKIKIWGHIKSSYYNRPILVLVLTKQEKHIWRNSEVHSDTWHAGHFSNSYKINSPWSHNVVHTCDHATFNVDCCYDILQHLLRICMSTNTSVKFLVIRNPTSLNCPNIFRSLNNKQNISCMKVCQDNLSLTEAHKKDAVTIPKFAVCFKKSCRVKTT